MEMVGSLLRPMEYGGGGCRSKFTVMVDKCARVQECKNKIRKIFVNLPIILVNTCPLIHYPNSQENSFAVVSASVT